MVSERNERFRAAGGGTGWWWASTGLLLAVIVALVVVLVFAPEDHTTEVGTSRATSQAPGVAQDLSTSSVEQGAEPCPLPADDQDIPVSGPSATWVTYGFAFVPQSSVYGPVQRAGSEWGCFAHSPTGALFAAANLFAELGDPDYEQVAGDALMANHAATNWLADQDPADRKQSAGQVAQFAGFQFQSVEPDRVVVAVALAQAEVTGAVKVALVWDADAGTWRGDVASSTLTPYLVDVDTFTPWSATDG